MKPNPGGILAPSEIVGRDQVVAYLQATLQQQSVLITAERRTGKTHVLGKFESEAPKNWAVIKRDIGAIRSAAEFAQYVLADLYPYFSPQTNFRHWLNSMGKQLGGTKIGPVALPNFASKDWKKTLEDAISHLDELPNIEKAVFLWDELPWMLEAITKNNPQEAMELLDCLRALRQTKPAKLRMVFTGSLGLHHIVQQLKDKGYNNTPVNDMLSIEVEPLSLADATNLAQRLCHDSGLQAAGEDIHALLATSVDCMPYYVHHVVSSLLKTPNINSKPLDALTIEAAITQAIHSADNPWDLQHYEARTLAYYGAQRGECLALLDAVASSRAPIPIAAAIQRAKAAYPVVAQQDWIELTRLLERDHYFKRTPTGEVTFKFTVVKRWWIWHRSLATDANTIGSAK
jgi:uncharacterized protein